ncbi:hypothetical protein DY218_11760 [Streptomyces triticagri]|uniref:Uncharacterized protein n=1 Tax=Streptomyces triticagri TaxID=2293568 RepID=A0A372M6M8_9ACTN|nr:hypothetical protein [Streptomyces triticagri]RFU86586.1 hypothetical protein DY218_11760 [Streptomyces triticagri]
MGDRANYVVVEDGSWQLYYSHWGATTVDVDILDGPRSAARFLRAQRATDRTDWLDDTWCEGAVLADYDNSRLLLFTWHLDDRDHRDALFAVLARTWPGWRIDWAYEGLRELAAYVGADPSAVTVEPSEPTRQAPLQAVEPGEEEYATIVSVRDDRGPRAYSLFVDDLPELLAHGPALVDRLPQEARCEGEQVVPADGVHIDVPRREVCAWISDTLFTARCPELPDWPGWTWTFWADRYAEQVTAAQGAVRFLPPDLRPAVAMLAGRIDRLGERDPAASAHALADRLREDGSEVRVSPFVDAHTVTGPDPGERAALRAVLAELG